MKKPNHKETSQLICSANLLTGCFMITYKSAKLACVSKKAEQKRLVTLHSEYLNRPTYMTSFEDRVYLQGK